MTTKPRNDALEQILDRASSDLVLTVDDVPDNLSVLHDALDESGYTVLVVHLLQERRTALIAVADRFRGHDKQSDSSATACLPR